MAQRKDTTNLQALLFQFMGMADLMLGMLEWLCAHMMEVEVSNQIGAEKHQQSTERSSGFRPRRLDTRMGTMYLYLLVPKIRNGGYIPFFVTERSSADPGGSGGVRTGRLDTTNGETGKEPGH